MLKDIKMEMVREMKLVRVREMEIWRVAVSRDREGDEEVD